MLQLKQISSTLWAFSVPVPNTFSAAYISRKVWYKRSDWDNIDKMLRGLMVSAAKIMWIWSLAKYWESFPYYIEIGPKSETMRYEWTHFLARMTNPCNVSKQWRWIELKLIFPSLYGVFHHLAAPSSPMSAYQQLLCLGPSWPV